MIRIIAGKWKGRQVVGVPKDPGVRPITARMRQSLFDILRPWVPGSRFLDLYAGSGAVGLEALSRGAERVVFVERDPRCVKGIERNLENMGAQGAEVMRLDILSGLGRLRGMTFDLVFAGPPYKDDHKRMLKLAVPTLQTVRGAGLLAPKGLLVVQHHKTEPAPAPEGLAVWRTHKYGDTLIEIYRWKADLEARQDATLVTGENGL